MRSPATTRRDCDTYPDALADAVVRVCGDAGLAERL